ncbi:cupin domain-containing protein [Cereibacter sphaeroides]|jgi:quercetin dioxygenase-like cupin family protein|uniref:Cupin domain-containing protein n=2 Tax=Cereibacter TaxID=1653176 RepID=A0AAX1UGU7_CERSP|nr:MULTISPECIES: cupin domain-containing protein [Cereibacter]ABN77238.1 Cupin 2, conserved barrel domain protein [Cereibacter sphaeroides ATCC 17029]EKX56048.1 Pectin degradation protein KdgF [Rhodobacter sp. AKP1]MCE8421402.1 cupin domain-containing protein [Rhodovulum sulfidophilum]RDS97570.1 cupin domain-containing protein [Cereibacter sphaeroides f. sp. denitrificans]ACM01676.1 Cupin 2, conserved barrel domain protein [Cereibacter sphaeroides KD131]
MYPVVPTDPGVTRQVLAQDPALMLVAFRFEEGAEGKLHSHPHVQSTFVQSGRFAFVLAGETHEIGPGESLMIPSGIEHGCRCLEAGTLIDSFAPRRDDFL